MNAFRNPFSADRIARNPWPVLIAALLATVVSVALLFRMRPETSIEGLLDRSDPSVLAMGRVMNGFPVVEEMLVLATLPAAAPDDPAPLLAFARRFEAAARRDEAVTIASVQYAPPADMRAFVQREIVPNGLDYLDDAAFAQLRDRLTRAGMDEQLARARAALSAPGPAAGEIGKQLVKDPLRLYEFLTARLARLGPIGASMGDAGASLSGDRRSLLIRVSGTSPPSDLAFCRRMVASADRLIAATNTDGLSIEVAGAYAVAAHSAAAIRTDSIVGVNTSVIGIALLFALFYRRAVRQFLFAFVPMAMGMLWGFGVYALWHDTFTPLAAVVGGALGGVGIDYFVFFLAHHRRNGGAVATTLVQLRRPLLAAWLTSVVGFLAIALSPIGVLRDFAILGSLALLGAYVATITLLPAALAAFDRPSTHRPERGDVRLGFLAPLGRLLAARPRTILIMSSSLWLLMLLFVLVGPGSLRPDANLMSLHPQPNPPIDAQRAIASRMGMAPGSIQIHLRAADADRLLRLSHEVDARLGGESLKRAGFVGSFSIASLVPDPAKAQARRGTVEVGWGMRVAWDLRKALEGASFNVAPFEPYMVFIGRLLMPNAAPPDVATLLRYPQVARLFLSHEAIRGEPATDALCLAFFDNPLEHRGPRDAALAALRDAVGGVPGVTITGMTPINAHLEASIYRDLPRLVAAALACIALCLLVHFRSWRLGLLAIAPTVVSITIVLAFMKLTGQPLTLVNMVMVPLLMGIDVDYSILTINAWTRSRTREELVAALPTTLSAVITCVATTLLGFGTLALTSIPAVQSLGLLITVGVLSCLAASVCVLWPILLLTRDARVLAEEA